MLQTIHTVVFQAAPGGGNPCPVTLEADNLTAGQMQEMARRFGEESAFLTKPSLPGCHVRARYFVPLHEMEMCVHATIASASVLVEKGLAPASPIVFETCFGPVNVHWARRDGGIEVGVEQFAPKFLDANPTAEEVCRALNIAPDALGEGPIQSAATSRFKLMVPLKSRAVLDNLRPDFEALWALCDRYETTGFYPYVLERDAGAPVFFARQFPKRAGYPEDPATGVAASALGAYLVHHRILPVQEGWNRFTVFQGFAMGRPSVIASDVFVQNGAIVKTQVRGSARLEE